MQTKLPNKIDPTRTTLLRRKLMQALGRRFRWLRGQIRKAILGEIPISNVRRYAPLSSADQLQRFIQWLQQQIDLGVLGGADPFDSWLAAYIQQAWDRGSGRAINDFLRGRNYSAAQQDFLASSFGRAASVDRVKALASISYTNLKGITDQMSMVIQRTLTEGLIQGKSPRTLARELSQAVQMSQRRAMTMARTEIIRAHAEGQLFGLEMMGVEKVGVMVEWSTAGDDRVCPLCADQEGKVYKIKDAHGLIPLHPNCRCAWIPANVGENKNHA